MTIISARIDENLEQKFEELRDYYESHNSKKYNNREIIEVAINHLYEHVFDADVIASAQQQMKQMMFDEMTNLLGTTFTSFFQLLDEIRTKLNLVDSKLDLDIQKSFETYEVIELMIRMMFMPDPLTKTIIRPTNANEVDRALRTDYIATIRTRESAKLKYEKVMKTRNWQHD